MNEEIEYAEMLEIPVSTVNVVRKKRARKRKNERAREHAETPPSDLKESVIAQVNDKLLDDPVENEITADAALFAESANSTGNIDFSDIPERIDTVRLYSAREKAFRREDIRLDAEDYTFENGDLANEGGRYASKRETKAEKRVRFVLGAEFAAACALCGAIFLTNVFMPSSAINTFFRALDGSAQTTNTDNRTYADFTLSSVVSELSDAELTLSPTGILSFTDECCVYPAADGKVSAVTQNADGTYTLKIAHSDTFTGVIGGLDQVYYQEGDTVKANVPVGYSTGEAEVQVTMYSDGALLNCFELTEENCLAWVVQE
ncbi:MAG: M23 family metallopeptidase [Clostridia bacterium]|nr:M23 family metallopeptidase [Clostridia bacterium]